jgi:glycosyltransferase involved in cell wall biosynthesis
MRFIDVYYAVKPWIPRSVQIGMRRRVVARRRAAVADEWPILESAGHAPPGWPGWPEGRKFALVLTHDVDTARGRDRCLQLAAIDERHGCRSAFNFVPHDYALDESLRRDLVRRGFEVGVHGLEHDGKLFRSERTFRAKAKTINEYLRAWSAQGFRAPAMHHNLDWIRALDIAYDSSTFDTDPFEPQPDGSGTIFPFLVGPQAGMNGGGNGHGHRSYVELPYTLPQDFTLFVLMREETIDIWKRKLDWIAMRGGMALLNVHPDYMAFEGKPGFDEYDAARYEEFLEYARTTYAGQYWQALPREAAAYCRSLGDALPTRKRRRVCMAAYAFYDTDNRIIRYAESLVRRGDLVDVLALRREGQPANSLVNGVRVSRIQHRERNERGKLDYLLRLLQFFIASSSILAWRTLTRRYDVIHIHSVPDFEVFAAWFAKLGGSRIILDIHDIVPEFYASKFGVSQDSAICKSLIRIERWSTQFANHVIIANHLWRDRLLTRTMMPASRCSVFLNCVDANLFYPRPRLRTDGRFILVYHGGLQWHQGLDLAVRAFGRVRDAVPSAEFHIYGEGGEKPKLLRIIAELGLQAQVLIKPVVPFHEIPALVAEADMGIVPKRADSFGNEAFSTKIFEFMAMGVPVVVSRTAIDSYYFNNDVVRFFTSGQEEELAEEMRALMTDPAARRAQADRALSFVRRHLWDTRRGAYTHLIDQMAEGRRDVEAIV